MKKLIIISGILLLFTLITTSCNHEPDNQFSLNSMYISLGNTDTINTFGYQYIVILDNGDTLLPAASNFPKYKPANKQRLLVNYTLLDFYGNSPGIYYAKINNLQEILFKNLIDTTLSKSDPIIVTDIWQTGNILNLDLQYMGSYKTHIINLAITNNNNENVELQLHHNANNDEQTYKLNGIVSFSLTELAKIPADSVNYTVWWTDYENTKHQYHGVFINK